MDKFVQRVELKTSSRNGGRNWEESEIPKKQLKLETKQKSHSVSEKQNGGNCCSENDPLKLRDDSKQLDQSKEGDQYKQCDQSKHSDQPKLNCNETATVNTSDDTPSCSNDSTEGTASGHVVWKELRREKLNCDYCLLYERREADTLLAECEKTLVYNTGQLAKVQIFGKWHDIPRKQVAHGDSGLTYSFSGTTVPARPWIPLLSDVRDKITKLTGQRFNFVLINRYKDGDDHIGEHRDDESDLDPSAPIASLSLGQARDFVFKHAKSRGKNATRKIEPVTLKLKHGMLLMMNQPTNKYWYHSLPKRKKCPGVRISMTFRRMAQK